MASSSFDFEPTDSTVSPRISGSRSSRASSISSSRSSSIAIADFNLSDNDQIRALETLLEHQLILTTLAAYSNYEFQKNRRQIQQDNVVLLSLLNACTNLKAAKADQIADLEARNNSLTTPPTAIRHFGFSSRHSNGSTVDALPALQGGVKDAAEYNTAPLRYADTRTTMVFVGQAANNQTIQAELQERYLDIPGGSKKFVTEIHQLPPDIDNNNDQLMQMARATVQEFLAAAETSSNKLNFEDGFSNTQLATFISYCEFKGFEYEVGDMQKVRSYYDELQADAATKALLSDEEWTKVKNNKVLNIDAAKLKSLVAKVTELQGTKTPTEAWKEKLSPTYKSDSEWQTWTNNNYDPRIPTLGKEELASLIEIRDNISHEHGGPINRPASTSKAGLFSQPFVKQREIMASIGGGPAKQTENNNNDDDERIERKYGS